MGIIITILLGIFLLAGVLVVKLAKNSEKVEQLSISIALGTMFSLVAIELIPDVMETFVLGDSFSGWNLAIAIIAIVVGVGLFKILDHFIPDHEEHDDKEEEHENTSENMIHIGIISAVAIILHNIVEGMAVYSITSDSLKDGILVAIGVGLHNIPMGMLMYSTLEKESRVKRVVILALAAVSTFVGGLLMAFISPILSELFIGILICLALGMLIYIIFFELIPHLIHTKNKWLSVIGILAGVLVIIISTFLE